MDKFNLFYVLPHLELDHEYNSDQLYEHFRTFLNNENLRSGDSMSKISFGLKLKNTRGWSKLGRTGHCNKWTCNAAAMREAYVQAGLLSEEKE